MPTKPVPKKKKEEVKKAANKTNDVKNNELKIKKLDKDKTNDDEYDEYYSSDESGGVALPKATLIAMFGEKEYKSQRKEYEAKHLERKRKREEEAAKELSESSGISDSEAARCYESNKKKIVYKLYEHY
jgi:hypothetical protein